MARSTMLLSLCCFLVAPASQTSDCNAGESSCGGQDTIALLQSVARVPKAAKLIEKTEDMKNEGDAKAAALSLISLFKSAYGNLFSPPLEAEKAWNMVDKDTTGTGSVDIHEFVDYWLYLYQAWDKFDPVKVSPFLNYFVGRRTEHGAYRCTVNNVRRANGKITLNFVTRGLTDRLGPLQPAKDLRLVVDNKTATLLKVNLDTTREDCVDGDLVFTDPLSGKLGDEILFEYGNMGRTPVVSDDSAGIHGVARRLLDSADKDRDGKISRAEFDSFCLGLFDSVATSIGQTCRDAPQGMLGGGPLVGAGLR